jgi:hypothetical protein
MEILRVNLSSVSYACVRRDSLPIEAEFVMPNPEIVVQLPLDRTKTGSLILVDDSGNTLAGPYDVLGKADNGTAVAHGNPNRDPLLPYGDTPEGIYGINRAVATGNGTVYTAHSYGPYGALVLQPISGDAQTAANAGRIGLMIHSGDAGQTNPLRPTHGCLRLSNDSMNALMQAIANSSEVDGISCQMTRISVIVGNDSDPAPTEDAGDPPPNMQSIIDGTYSGQYLPLPLKNPLP